jgi:hypothetical protein
MFPWGVSRQQYILYVAGEVGQGLVACLLYLRFVSFILGLEKVFQIPIGFHADVDPAVKECDPDLGLRLPNFFKILWLKKI